MAPMNILPCSKAMSSIFISADTLHRKTDGMSLYLRRISADSRFISPAFPEKRRHGFAAQMAGVFQRAQRREIPKKYGVRLCPLR